MSPSPESLGPSHSHSVIVYFGDQALKATEIVSVFGFVGRMDRARELAPSFAVSAANCKSHSPNRARLAPPHATKMRGALAQSDEEEGILTQPVLKFGGPRRVPRYFVIVGE